MAGRFSNKVVAIVGGNSGIGLASAKAFADEGAQVVIAGRDLRTLKSAQKEIGSSVLALQCDIAVVGQIAELFREIRERLARIDILFVNAGVLALQPIGSITEADWAWVQDINVKGTFFSIQEAVPLMPSGSAIILTSSTAAHRGVANASLYAASKGALSALGRALAAELLSHGIRVNVVSPGPVDTPIFDRVRGLPVDGENSIRQKQAQYVPMGRMGTSREVADAVVFLASDAASFINGIDLVVDGGILNLTHP